MRDIEDALTLDERSRVDFALGLRQRWADRVYPVLAAQTRRAVPAGPADLTSVTALLHQQDLYPWFSHLERAQQKMMWRAAGDAVLAHRAELTPGTAAASGECPGELRLDPELALPDWYTGVDIHVQPGGVWGTDESALVYELGARIVMLRDNDGYRFHELFSRTALPDLPDAVRVVDVGCGFGKSTRPLVTRYPRAEVIGLDLAAPNLRLAHAEAAAAGLDISFRQADARATGLPDGSVDLLTGTMVLHEMPADAIRETLAEAARVLRPGGELRFLEFWHTGDLVRDATVYEHAERNNEPYLRDLLDADVPGWCAELGLGGAAWLPFDERTDGLRTADAGWPARAEWHFPWAVLTATREG